MVLRIRLDYRTVAGRAAIGNRRILLAAASLLMPVSVVAYAMGLWRLGADLGWVSSFAIEEGIFSHWQSWMAAGAATQAWAAVLNRWARRRWKPAQRDQMAA